MDIKPSRPNESIVTYGIDISTIYRHEAVWKSSNPRHGQRICGLSSSIVLEIQTRVFRASLSMSHNWSKVDHSIIPITKVYTKIVTSYSTTSLLNYVIMHQICSSSSGVQSGPMELPNVIKAIRRIIQILNHIFYSTFIQISVIFETWVFVGNSFSLFVSELHCFCFEDKVVKLFCYLFRLIQLLLFSLLFPEIFSRLLGSPLLFLLLFTFIHQINVSI